MHFCSKAEKDYYQDKIVDTYAMYQRVAEYHIFIYTTLAQSLCAAVLLYSACDTGDLFYCTYIHLTSLHLYLMYNNRRVEVGNRKQWIPGVSCEKK